MQRCITWSAQQLPARWRSRGTARFMFVEKGRCSSDGSDRKSARCILLDAEALNFIAKNAPLPQMRDCNLHIAKHVAASPRTTSIASGWRTFSHCPKIGGRFFVENWYAQIQEISAINDGKVMRDFA